MKSILCFLLRSSFRSLGPAVYSLALAAAQAASPSTQAGFPYLIQVEPGATEFAPGDSIVITSVRGNRANLEVGGTYELEGKYTLTSADRADLAWFATEREASGPKPVSDAEHTMVTKGSGTFRLTKTFADDGWLHVSFYVNGQSHGGIYFGEKGVERTILRKKSWSDFGPAHASNDGNSGSASAGTVHPANVALLNYLGEPVAAPENLDPKYGPKELAAAFREACKREGLKVKTLSVDDSEFPFLLYGLIEGKHEFREIESGLRAMKDYVYAGSVTGADDRITHFAMNIIPQDRYPYNRAVTCNRRLMVRLQMLADLARNSEQ